MNHRPKIHRLTCPQGHDRTLPDAVNEYGRCKLCVKETKARRAARKPLKQRCSRGHAYTEGSFKTIYRTDKHGTRIPYRDCLECRHARRDESAPVRDRTSSLVTIAQITEKILAIADRQDLAGGWERQQLRARVAELTMQKDQLERKTARKVAQ